VQDDVSILDRLLDTMDVRITAFALLRISPGYRLNFNGSTAPVVHFVLAGNARFEFPEGPVLPVEQGDVVVLPPACRKVIQVGAGPFREVRSIDQCRAGLTGLAQVDAGESPAGATILCGLVGSGVLGCHGLFDRLSRPLLDGLRGTPFGTAAFALLRYEIERPGFASQALAGALMKACLALVIRQHLDTLLAPYSLAVEPANGPLRHVLFHVMQHPTEPHSVASLGRIAGMSRTAFARAFTAAFGTSPMAFITKIRLRNAAELLRSTDLPVKMIAASSGLSRSHFSRAFRSAYGRDPLSFRSDVAG
jgi:AraC family transcriptional activator of mtrCDE